MNLAFDYFYKNIPNTDIDQRFKIDFKPVTRPLLSWKEELIISAKQIVESTNKPIYVLMSGGIDSEVVARLLIEIGADFKALTIKHKNSTNHNDTVYAYQFCKENNIDQIMVELDTEHFLTLGIEKYINQGYRSSNIYHYQQLFILETLEKLGGFGIGGAGEQIYQSVNNQIHLKFNPYYMLGMDWCKNNGTEHQLWFNLSTPEIYASYLNIDIISFLLEKPEYFVNHHFASIEKILIYHKYWPTMKKRKKLSGFENINRGPIEKQLKIRFPDLVDMFIPITVIKNQLGVS